MALDSEFNTVDKWSHMWRIVRLLLANVLVATLITVVYVALRNVVPSKCTGLPSFMWWTLWESFWIGIVGGSCAIANLKVSWRPEMMPSWRRMTIASMTFFVFLTLFQYLGLSAGSAARVSLYKVPAALMFMLVLPGVMWQNLRNVKKPAGVDRVSLWRAQNKKLVTYCFAWGITFFAGFYISLFFATKWFPAISSGVKEAYMMKDPANWCVAVTYVFGHI